MHPTQFFRPTCTRLLTTLLASAGITLLAATDIGAAEEVRLVGINGIQHHGECHWQQQGVAFGEHVLPYDQIAWCEFTEQRENRYIDRGVLLSDGSLIIGHPASLRDGELTFNIDRSGPTQLPQTSLAAIIFAPQPAASLLLDREVGVHLVNGDSVGADVAWIDAAQIGVKLGRRIVPVPRERTAVVRLKVEDADQHAHSYCVRLSSGELLKAEQIVGDGRDLLITHHLLGEIRLPTTAIKRIWNCGTATKQASELAEQRSYQPMFSEDFRMEIDRSNDDHRFAYDQRHCEYGLRCQGRSEIVIPIPDGATGFITEVALDQTANDTAAATIKVTIEGQQRIESPVTSEAMLISESVVPGEHLTLTIDFATDPAAYPGPVVIAWPTFTMKQ